MMAALLLTSLTAPGPGIPEALARERAAVIADLRYQLDFRIPEARSEPIRGREVVRFRLAEPHRVVLDFAPARDHILSVQRGGRPIEFTAANNHLIVAAEDTAAGENELTLEFLAGEDSLNRGADLIYTLFVPARAHLAFPCFDQPDLKAKYTLSLELPAGWRGVANGRATATEAVADGRSSLRFAETAPLPTYLFAFAAGRFQVETATRNGREFNMLHRETDPAKVARNRDAIFDLHASALAWLEEYTGIPYPFGKFDFVLIPSFQFGGMEHAGAILYNASGLMLDESATQNQLLGRASVIAHETAHMWFGDLVTMRWFDDVWMKEVMANFMAAKIVNPSFPDVNHELRFLLSHYPAAYEMDRTAGTNPIRQPLENLGEAGQLYGAIIYQKAPIVMRQLEGLLGEGPFRDGLREYLKAHAFGNATWTDLVGVLDARTPLDLVAWSRAWVEERGRPILTTRLRLDARQRIAALALDLRDPLGRGLVWPQRLQVTLGYPDSVQHLAVAVDGPTTQVAEARGRPRPQYVLPGGIGYGLFVLDPRSRAHLLAHLEDIADPLTRGSAWVTLWENLLDGRLDARELLDLATRALPKESDEQNTQRILGNVVRAYWRFLPQRERLARAPALERLLRYGLAAAEGGRRKAAWFAALRDVVQTREGLRWLESVWRRDETVPGLSLAETDEINMALELAVRDVPGAEGILDTQLARTKDPDRKARLEFVRPALSADPSVREAAFERFRKLENRRREPWVLEAQSYLNHPLREEQARHFIRPSLELLREIRDTGDIFFPKRWMDATLRGHRSAEAVAVVRGFLAGEPAYPERLRWTVLSSLDDVERAARGTQTPSHP